MTKSPSYHFAGDSVTDALAPHQSRLLFEQGNGQRVYYSDVLALADTSSLRDVSGRLVFCLCENNVESLNGYVALLCARAVPLMLGPSLYGAHLSVMIEKYRPDFIWCPKGLLNQFPQASLAASIGDYALASLGSVGYPIDEQHALLLPTSGSTGSPKFVRLSHQNILSNAAAIAQYLKLDQDETPITSLPPHYSYGLSVIHSHAMVGAKIAVTPASLLEKDFWGFFEASSATSFAGVPYQYELMKKLRFTRKRYPALRTLTQAGGRLQPEITREFAEYSASVGIRYYTMYGQSEASPRIAFLDPQKALEKPGSIGKAIPGGRMWLEDERGTSVAEVDAVGELIFSGPNVAMGYAEGFEDLAAGDLWGGVLRTGDLARRDSDGDFTIVGRLKRFIKLFGHRTNLHDIENELSGLGFEVACGGTDDSLEIYVAHVSGDDAERLKIVICKGLGVPPTAVKVFRVKQLPRNDAGKVLYDQLPSQAGEVLT